MIIEEDDYLSHYGILRRSGRYPWDSGGNAETVPQRSKNFISWLQDMRNKGLTEPEIAKGVGMSTTDLRALNSIAKNQWKQSQITQAQLLKDKGTSNVAIGESMGLNESSVRALLAPGAKEKASALTATSDMLKAQVAEKTYLDVGIGNENYLGISKEKLGNAVTMLKAEGYEVHTIKVQQLGTRFETEVKVLAPPGTTWGEVKRNQGDIKTITNFSEDGGLTFAKVHAPLSIDTNRVSVKYGEDGGEAADGVIYVRPGVDDLSLGGSSYAQVRVQVGGEHYLKGMAMYKAGLPDGVDLQFNTNKSDTGNKLDAMKPLERDASGKVDKDLPFGSIVRQIVDAPGSPNERVTSVMNIVNDEGKWAEWSKTLSAQMLSKQSPRLAREQLDVTYERRQKELDEILALTNPTIKKKLLDKFAEGTDADAVHLKAAAIPRQQTRVILPINSLPDTQIYAPTFRDGERVALIRYPHGGTFEIPDLTVNNKNAESKRLLGDARDAVGINSKVAERLSGADFDGDTVLVIPNNAGKLTITPALEGLKNFKPRETYKAYDGMKRMTSRETQLEMGNVSNLITDMTLRGAPHSDLVRAVRHSMVVIDAEKHNLNYKESAARNGIKQLKEQYQGRSNAGASTLISKKKSEIRVPELKPRPQKDGGPVDRKTGALVFVETGKTRLNAKGESIPKLQKIKKLENTDDAFTLLSNTPTPMEKLYAQHSNNLKGLANKARLESIATPSLKYSKSAKQVYSKEVATLNSKLALAERNAPRERQAQVVAGAVVKAKRDSNPDLAPETRKKMEYQELERARARMGARKELIDIFPKEWEAIQNGAISDSRLGRILNNTDIEVVRKLATPRPAKLMSPTKMLRAQSMLASGYTRADIADQLGVSLSTLDEATKG